MLCSASFSVIRLIFFSSIRNRDYDKQIKVSKNPKNVIKYQTILRSSYLFQGCGIIGALDNVDSWINSVIDNNLWYVSFVFLIGLGIYFTYKLRLAQLTKLPEAMHVTFEGKKVSKKNEAVTSFEAFCIGLGARVGVGNIAGVAAAIAVGGPGAVFWMWIFAIIGAASAFMECTLAQIFKEREKDNPSFFVGGPAFYIKNGLKNHKFAVFLAVLTVITYGIGFVGQQAGNSADAFVNAFDFEHNDIVFGIILTAIAAAIFLGGIKRIAKASYYVVPAMAICWLVLCLILVLINYDQIWNAITLIVGDAFDPADWVSTTDSLFGGALGMVILTGLRRGVFSNEAGIGSVPNVASTANVKHPVKQGLIQSMGVLIDTLVVCSATAFVILTYSDFDVLIQAGSTKAALVQDVMGESFLDDAAKYVVSIFLVVFAFSSLIGYYSISENNVKFLTDNKMYTRALQALIIAVVFFSSVVPINLVYDLCDVFMACMGIFNMIAVAMLAKYAFIAFRDYFRQKEAGIAQPEFCSDTLKDAGLDTSGITVWDKGMAASYSDDERPVVED